MNTGCHILKNTCAGIEMNKFNSVIINLTKMFNFNHFLHNNYKIFK